MDTREGGELISFFSITYIAKIKTSFDVVSFDIELYIYGVSPVNINNKAAGLSTISTIKHKYQIEARIFIAELEINVYMFTGNGSLDEDMTFNLYIQELEPEINTKDEWRSRTLTIKI